MKRIPPFKVGDKVSCLHKLPKHSMWTEFLQPFKTISDISWSNASQSWMIQFNEDYSTWKWNFDASDFEIWDEEKYRASRTITFFDDGSRDKQSTQSGETKNNRLPVRFESVKDFDITQLGRLKDRKPKRPRIARKLN